MNKFHIIPQRLIMITFSSLLIFTLFYQPLQASSDTFYAEVTEIVDGDTIRVKIKDHTETVRYLLIDTPELHHPKRGEEELGAIAMMANREIVEDRGVTLETDILKRDRYGRLLAYVWIDTDEGRVMVNEELVLRGFAMPMTIPPNVKYDNRISSAFMKARKNEKGLWARASARNFTAEQAWSELPYIEGYFITLELRIRDIIESGNRKVILPEKGNFTIVVYNNDWQQCIEHLPERGRTIKVAGRARKGFHGGEIILSDPAQIVYP